MIVAELEAFFSRPVAPTRRIAIGGLTLPEAGSVGAAAMLLGGLCAEHGRYVDGDDLADLRRLIADVEFGRRVPQPRLRHRCQKDRVGLKRSSSTLVVDRAGMFHLHADRSNGTPVQHLLAAVYSMEPLGRDDRYDVAASLRTGLQWRGRVGPQLLGALRGSPTRGGLGGAALAADPVEWALGVLDLPAMDGGPTRSEVRRAFRRALRNAHPDHGAPGDGAAGRIEELDTARRILLG